MEMVDKTVRSALKQKRAPRNYFPLLVVLIIIACLATGLAISFGSGSLDAGQRWTLIGFLIAFSVFGLIFALFGSAFSEWLTLREMRKLSAAENERQTVWETITPDTQKEKLNDEVSNLAMILDVPDEQLSDLLSAYIVAEDLALRQIQQEEKTPLLRHIAVGDAAFDAVLLKYNLLTCIDVTFLVAPEIEQEKISDVLRRVGSVKKILAKLRPELKVKLLFVVVTQLEPEEVKQLRQSLNHKRFPDTPVDIDIRLKDFADLQKIYAGG